MKNRPSSVQFTATAAAAATIVVVRVGVSTTAPCPIACAVHAAAEMTHLAVVEHSITAECAVLKTKARATEAANGPVCTTHRPLTFTVAKTESVIGIDALFAPLGEALAVS